MGTCLPVKMKLLCIIAILCSLAYADKNSCPLEDISYGGIGSTLIAYLTDADDWQECGKICHKFAYPEKCEFWTLNEYRTCYLFTDDNGIGVDEGNISGDKDCYE